MSWDVAIIGGGVVGTAIARELARYQLRCVLLEAADDVGTGTSKANTAILHTGFDAGPGTLESRLVTRGSSLLREYAQETGIAVEPTGALLVAWTPEQASSLDAIVEKARANGYLGAVPVSESGVYEREPHLGPGAVAGLWIPDEAVIDPWSVSLAFATEAVRAGVALRLRTRVSGVAVLGGGEGFELAVDSGPEPVRCRFAVNAAGLASDQVDRMFGCDGFSIQPRKGELIVFDKLARPLLSSIILPVPTPRTKGVLVAPTVFGNVLVGPTAEDVADRSDLSTSAAGLAALVAAGRQILPSLEQEEVTATYAGLRAATEHRDYQVSRHGRYARVAGIRSTGLTASLAIAEHVAGLLEEAGLALKPRTGDGPARPRMPYLGEAGPRPYQLAERIAADPAYGEIACHCERVTKGEIRDALASDLPPAGLDGLRRRTRAMNGRCQAFFCGAEVSAMFSRADAGLRAEGGGQRGH
ncbi:MAG TPA: NAD(P)/FAD-dependent oxidoreductase [Streptosporangiaceae bacterium]